MNPYLEKYLDLLWRMFEYDINVFSQPWMYYWIMMPALGYFIFFMAKWAVLTTPFWLPISLILRAARSTKPKTSPKKKRKEVYISPDALPSDKSKQLLN